ncbi:phosphatase PAP2 family protein [Methylobacterium iners]|uniref:Inositolphosphotransferase Aur1/Ipt1 domain-containing protein n=1 Tax=Methylobacterium iners TaxID=418707 RepID=A0ABQ4S1G5_9HYPH|nr:phosphatase PAP2 family protein [Methylobacterium iners]GJD96283.1 hypothetical protein OCOJLMKI_3503 [Methylobacterium iners]
MTAGTLDPAHQPALRRPSAPKTWTAKLLWYSSAVAAPGVWVWVAISAIVVIDAVWVAMLRISVEPKGFGLCAAAVGLLLLAAVALGRLKSLPKLRAMALSSACLVALTVPIAVLHYLAASLSLPLVDPTLAQVEAALGFDWQGYLGFLAAHPTLSWWLALAYHSSGPQVALVVIVLSATGRLGRLWRFVRLFAATLIITIAASVLLPAEGPYAYYEPAVRPAGKLETVGALWHLEALQRLRSGTLEALSVTDLRALVTFPSFHMCLAILTAWALYPLPFIGPATFLLNVVVAVATIGAGGHYLPDLIAGAALAFGSLMVSRRWFGGPYRAASRARR